MPSVHQINTLEELPNALKTYLIKKINLDDVTKYIEQLFATSFEFDGYSLMVDQINRFYTTGFEPQMSEVSEPEIKSFVKENNNSLDLLSNEFIKKIHSYQ